MYGSIRLFMDDNKDGLIHMQKILGVFECFSTMLRKDYDFFSYTLWSPDEDRTIIDRIYTNTATGKNELLNEQIKPVVKGKYGDLSAPVLWASRECKETLLYSDFRVRIEFPVYYAPLTICADFELKNELISFSGYINLLQDIQNIGFSINNGFFHVYSMKNEAETLNGGQLGSILSWCGHENIKRSIRHKQNGCLNRIMGIYLWNTIRSDLISDKVKSNISEIVGMNHIRSVDRMYSFSLPDDKISPFYRVKCQQTIKRLEKELSCFK